MEANSWDSWVDQALSRLHSLKLIRSLRPIHLPNPLPTPRDFEVFHHLSPWDRLAIEIKISEPTFLKWVNEIPSSGTPFCFFCLVLDRLSFPRSFSCMGVFKSVSFLNVWTFHFVFFSFFCICFVVLVIVTAYNCCVNV